MWNCDQLMFLLEKLQKQFIDGEIKYRLSLSLNPSVCQNMCWFNFMVIKSFVREEASLHNITIYLSYWTQKSVSDNCILYCNNNTSGVIVDLNSPYIAFLNWKVLIFHSCCWECWELCECTKLSDHSDFPTRLFCRLLFMGCTKSPQLLGLTSIQN